MKKRIFTLIVAIVPIFAFADEKPSIVITKTDGSNITVELSDLQSIKFSDGQMLITNRNQSEQTLAIDDIEVMTFGDMSTAISQLTECNEYAEVTVTDLTGKVVYRGKSSDFSSCQPLNGVYIVSSAGKSYKILINR